MGSVGRVRRKYPELLREILPGLTLLGCLFDTSFPGLGVYRNALERAAHRLGIDTFYADYQGVAGLDGGMEMLGARGVQAVFVYGSTATNSQLPKLVHFFAVRRLPDLYANSEAVVLGGLMSYGVDLSDLTVRSADYVDKILRGAKPADLPVQQPTKYDMTINLKTAKALGLKVPQSILTRADKLIECKAFVPRASAAADGDPCCCQRSGALGERWFVAGYDSQWPLCAASARDRFWPTAGTGGRQVRRRLVEVDVRRGVIARAPQSVPASSPSDREAAFRKHRQSATSGRSSTAA